MGRFDEPYVLHPRYSSTGSPRWAPCPSPGTVPYYSRYRDRAPSTTSYTLACTAGIMWECRTRRGTYAARQGRRGKGKENSEGRKRIRERKREKENLYWNTAIQN